jgi:hypothetical protein
MILPPQLEAFKIAFKFLENIGYLEYHSKKVIMSRLKEARKMVNPNILKTNNPEIISNAILLSLADQTIQRFFI